MSRTLELDDIADSGISLRKDLMARPVIELVALLEEATAAEITARRMTGRLLQRVATAEAANKQRAAEDQAMLTRWEGDIYEEAVGGQETATDVLTTMLDYAVKDMLTVSGQTRKARATYLLDIVGHALERDDTDPSGDHEEQGLVEFLALQFYVLCQFAETTPKPGTRANLWWCVGKLLYK